MTNRNEIVEQGWNFDNSYARLPETFFTQVDPNPVRAPKLILFNDSLATSLGLTVDALKSEEGAQIFAGNEIPEGGFPLAQAYAGHQFGHFTMLGDGRAMLIGEQITPLGERFDIQLKGSGQHRIPAEAMDERHLVRCYVNISLVKRCMRSVFQPPVV